MPLNYFHEEKDLFSRQEIFIFMKKNIFFHENNSERGTIICCKQEPIVLQNTYSIY